MIAIERVAVVAGQFALAGPVVAVRELTGGHINASFLVTTATADVIVQRVNRAIFAEPQLLVDNALVVGAHLGGALVPAPVPARSGGWLVADGAETWRAWARVASARAVSDPTPARVHSAAVLLGRFHAGLAALDPEAVAEVLPGFHGPARRLQELRAVVAADPVGRVAGAHPEVAAALTAAPLADVAADLVARVPRRVAHNDAKLDNFLFRGDEAVALVDLDTVMPTAWFWDCGDLLRTAATVAAEDEPDVRHAVVDHELYRSILAGYLAGVGGSLTNAEREALEHAGAIVTYEQALRFLTDWIAGDVYYRTTRAGQNLDRARAQLALLSSMPGTVAP